MNRKRLLLTGGTGFVGRNVLPIFRESYDVVAPTRQDLDLSNPGDVKRYFKSQKFDYLVHAAICNPAKLVDEGKDVCADVLSSFMSLCSGDFEKIVFIGSGAEFDKSGDVREVVEDDLGKRIPLDGYGIAKYVLTDVARRSANIYNARLFGCYGPGEPERRFIRHAIDCCLHKKPITIRKDCRFSYVFVDDLGHAIMRILESTPIRHDYNICGDRPYLLSELAEMVRRIMVADCPIEVMADGLANEYSCSGDSFRREFGDFRFTDLTAGICREIDWMKGLQK